jgi:hypothetical protein
MKGSLSKEKNILFSTTPSYEYYQSVLKPLSGSAGKNNSFLHPSNDSSKQNLNSSRNFFSDALTTSVSPSIENIFSSVFANSLNSNFTSSSVLPFSLVPVVSNSSQLSLPLISVSSPYAISGDYSGNVIIVSQTINVPVIQIPNNLSQSKPSSFTSNQLSSSISHFQLPHQLSMLPSPSSLSSSVLSISSSSSSSSLSSPSPLSSKMSFLPFTYSDSLGPLLPFPGPNRTNSLSNFLNNKPSYNSVSVFETKKKLNTKKRLRNEGMNFVILYLILIEID